MNVSISPTEDCALALDQADSLAGFRSRFHLLEDTIYMDGNSLGLLSKDAEAALLKTLEAWKTRGVAGWFEGENPWLDNAEEIGALTAEMMGAKSDQVIHSATVTVNIHALLASLYRPTGNRVKILADLSDDDLARFLGAAIGAITFSGSVIAFGKLSGKISGKPLLLPARHWINLLGLLVVIWFGREFMNAHSIAEGMTPITQAAVRIAREGKISLIEAWRCAM